MGKAFYESEEDTKARYITPALKASGWSTMSMLMEYSLKSDRFRIVPGRNKTTKEKSSSRNKPDYILCHGVNVPIAVVEAKKNSLIANDGLDQAIAYAKKLDIPFAFASAGDKFVEFNRATGQTTEFPLNQFPSPEELWRRWCEIRKVKPSDQRTLSDALYHTTIDGKVPRYYQILAINKTVNAIIADKRKRALLVMATGTGKTYTAFQIVWRLRQAGVVKNVLYLADRNQLLDQTMINDFAPLDKIQTKIKNGNINQNYLMYFGLYQQLKGREHEDREKDDVSFADNFRQVPPDYFDLIVVDECHRGSAAEESSWRVILDYFQSAIQIGMTATPNKNDGANNLEYFGDPLYIYSLKQGIEDGYLAPYQVINVHLDKDVTGWEPREDEVDDNGKKIPKRLYKRSDFNKTLILRDRIETVAKTITESLARLGPMSKTIVFCRTQRHAALMRDALRAFNPEQCKINPKYIMRMTADDIEGRAEYKAFTSINEEYPVVVTTSKLLTTGADTRCVKLIVLDAPIGSMTEFKQIIGRGTRLVEEADKTFFTILDFQEATTKFSDPEFDGTADRTADWWEVDPEGKNRPIEDVIDPLVPPTEEVDGDNSEGQSVGNSIGGDSSGGTDIPPPEPPEIYVVSGVEVTVTRRTVKYLDENGKLVTAKFTDYTRSNILKLFGTEDSFLEVWNGPEEKKAILRKLAEKGVLIEHLRDEMGNPDMDEFDLICAIAYGATPLTRQTRAAKVKHSKFLEKYQGVTRDVLEHLLDAYARLGIAEVDDIKILRNEPFNKIGSSKQIVEIFGGKDNYTRAIKEMQNILYSSDRSEKTSVVRL